MRRLMMIAPVMALALSAVACSEGAFNSPTSPGVDLSASATEAKGGRGGGGSGSGGTTTPPPSDSSLALVMIDDRLTPGVSYTDRVTFAVSTTATIYPWVTVQCFQNGVMVSTESLGIFTYSLDQEFALGPTRLWTGGAATCTATLENRDGYTKHGTIIPLASITIAVAG